MRFPHLTNWVIESIALFVGRRRMSEWFFIGDAIIPALWRANFYEQERMERVSSAGSWRLCGFRVMRSRVSLVL